MLAPRFPTIKSTRQTWVRTSSHGAALAYLVEKRNQLQPHGFGFKGIGGVQVQNLIRAAFIGTLALSSVSISGLPAMSQDLEFRVGPGGVDVRNRDRDRYPDQYEGGRDRRRGECTPDDALDAARDSGLRRARIARVTPRNVVVEGFTRRGPDRIVFANVRGCPEV